MKPAHWWKRRKGEQANAFKHGHNRKGLTTAEYRTWAGIKTRCLNPKSRKFQIYGGRGIKVCDRWLESFDNFLADMGRKPTPAHTIERKNRNGNYEPSNCIWATQKVQQRNRSTNHIIEFNGERKTMVEFAEQHAISVGTLWMRLRRGWTTERALTTPLFKR